MDPEGEGGGGLFKGLPAVDLPEAVLARQAQRRAGAVGAGPAAAAAARGGANSGVVALLVAVYRLRVPLVLGLLFLAAFVLLNAPPPPPPSSRSNSGPVSFL